MNKSQGQWESVVSWENWTLEFQKCIGLSPVIQCQGHGLLLKVWIQWGPWPKDCWAEGNTATKFSRFQTNNQPFSDCVWYSDDGLHDLCIPKKKLHGPLHFRLTALKIDEVCLEQSSRWWNQAVANPSPSRMSQRFCLVCVVGYWQHSAISKREQ